MFIISTCRDGCRDVALIVDIDVCLFSHSGIVSTTIDVSDGSAHDLKISLAQLGPSHPLVVILIVIVSIAAAKEIADEDVLFWRCRTNTYKSTVSSINTICLSTSQFGRHRSINGGCCADRTRDIIAAIYLPYEHVVLVGSDFHKRVAFNIGLTGSAIDTAFNLNLCIGHGRCTHQHEENQQTPPSTYTRVHYYIIIQHLQHHFLPWFITL